MRTTTRRATDVCLVLAGLLALGGCRDGAALFTAEDRLDRMAENPRRLTWSLADDRSPSWSAGGDSVYYSAEVAGPLAWPLAVIQAVPAGGGAARAMLGVVQDASAARRVLVTPVPSPDRRRIAYVEVWARRLTDACLPRTAARPRCDLHDAAALAPILTEVRVRVRDFAAVGPVERDPELSVQMHHFDEDPSRRPFGVTPVHVYRDHPFHQVDRLEGVRFFRPSWSAAGERLVVSDGLRLLTWTPGGGGASPVGGTEDGVSPAWSPDDGWIAFTRLVRGDSLLNTCVQYVEGEPVCQTEFHQYDIARRELTLVRPDGSELRVLGEGEDPAWAPDGRTLYFRAEDRLWRIGTDGGAAEAIPGTGSGREPAVSPDGRLLAFVRMGDVGGRDVYVLDLGAR